MTRSIQQLPNNTVTSSVVEVPTQTGFNAGDLVYFQNNDYKGAPNITSPSTANFAITGPQGIQTNGAGGLTTPVIRTATTYFGTSTSKSSALLTNGNIVNVWSAYTSSTGIMFQIVNTSNVVQVNPTVVSSTYINQYSSVGVLALTGGGFVVYWINSTGGTAGSMNYAIYTNTGSVTTAATQDTGFAFNTSYPYSNINGVPLANGGFALAGLTATYATFRAYNATGTGAYGATNTSTAFNSLPIFGLGMATRSDNSIILSYMATSTSAFYVLINSSGGVITSGTISSMSNSVDVTVLSDASTYVLAYNGTSSGTATPCFRFLPASNTLGSEFTTSSANLSSTGGGQNISVLGLTNGNFSYVCCDSYNNPYYAIFNSSGTAVYGTNANGTIWYPLYGIKSNNYTYTTQLELPTTINFYFADGAYNQNSNLNSYFFQISKTTFNPIPSLSTTGSYGSVTASVSGLSYANTTPSNLSFLASTTTTSGVNSGSVTASTLATQIYSSAICSLCSATLPNGQFLICYKDSSTYVVYVNIYSITGSLISTINVGTGYSDTTLGKAHISALSSGKFVVSYYNASNAITNSLYSSSYSLIASSNIPVVYGSGGGINVQCAGLTNDRFVVVFFDNSSYASFIVYDNTNTVIKAQANSGSATSNYIAVSANTTGGFAIGYQNYSANTFPVYLWENTTGTTYANVATYTASSCSGGTYSQAVFSNGFYYFLSYIGSSWIVNYVHSALRPNTYSLTGTQTSPSFANTICTMGITGNGVPVAFSPGNTAYSYNLAGLDSSGHNIAYPYTSTYNVTGLGTNIPVCVTSGIGNNVIVAYVNSSNIPVFSIINIAPNYNVYSLVSGTTPSSAISVYPNPNTSTTPIINAVLTGVAAQTVSAGSAGQVVINGPAQLNSNYTNTASGAFDHTGQPIDGVKGTYNGKLLNLQGNS